MVHFGVKLREIGVLCSFWGYKCGKWTHFWGRDEGKCVPLGIRGKIGFPALFWGINERKKRGFLLRFGVKLREIGVLCSFLGA